MKGRISTVLTKEFIYEVYCRIIHKPKDYERITRKRMLEEVFDYYREDNHLEMCLTYQDILDLKESISNNQLLPKYSLHLYQLLLLNYNHYQTLFINKDIFSFIVENIDNFDLEKAKKRDERNHLLIGMIKGYGIISISHFQKVISAFNKINNIDFDVKKDIIFNRYIREYYFIEEVKDSKVIVYNLFKNYYDELIEIQEREEYHFKVFGYHSLINIAKYDIDLSRPSLKKLYDEVIQLESPSLEKKIIENMIILLNLGNVFEDIKSYFSLTYELRSAISPLMKKYMMYAIEDIPLAIYYGLTIHEINGYQEDD